MGGEETEGGREVGSWHYMASRWRWIGYDLRQKGKCLYMVYNQIAALVRTMVIGTKFYAMLQYLIMSNGDLTVVDCEDTRSSNFLDCCYLAMCAIHSDSHVTAKVQDKSGYRHSRGRNTGLSSVCYR